MKKEIKPYTRMYLVIRALAGGYLMYTAWGLREGLAEDPLLVIAMAAFAVIGLALAAHAGWKLFKGEYEGGRGLAQSEEAENPAQEETAE